MSPPMHPAAPVHLPFFITSPGHTDGLFVLTAIVVLLTIVGIGVLYFNLHALPEQLAHRGQKVQFEIVAVLALLALFTHNHAFWIAGLLLALIPLPDFTSPLSSVARSLERIAAAADDRVTPPTAAASVAANPAPPAADAAGLAPPAPPAPAPGLTPATTAGATEV